MTKSENRAYKFAKQVNEMIKANSLTEEQVYLVLSMLLGWNGFEGMAKQLAANGCDIRGLDDFFLNGKIDGTPFGTISFEQLSLALSEYTERFWLPGLAKRRGRSQTYTMDAEAAKKLVFIWRDNHSMADLGEKQNNESVGG